MVSFVDYGNPPATKNNKLNKSLLDDVDTRNSSIRTVDWNKCVWSSGRIIDIHQ